MSTDLTLKQDAHHLVKEAANIQSGQSKAGKDTGKGTFASKAQSVADKATQDVSQPEKLTPSLTFTDVSQVMSAQATSGEDTGKDSFSAATQSVADRLAHQSAKDDTTKQGPGIPIVRPITQSEAAAVQSDLAKADKYTGKGSAAAFAQSAADKHARGISK